MIRPGIWRRELTVPLQSIQAELNRLFDEYWRPPGDPGGPGEGMSPSPGEAGDATGARWTPGIDVWDAPGELTVVVDLPGVDPGSIDLSLAGNVLSIRGDKPARPATAGADGAEGVRARVRERPNGPFHRQVTLVEEVDFDRVEARASEGVLTVTLPKRRQGPARTIPIRPANP